MGLSKKDVEKVAQLARIEFSEKEFEKFTTQLDAILGYVEKLNELDTSQVEPTAHVLPVKNVMREDKVTNQAPSEIVFQNAPNLKENLFKVPQVIE